MEASSPRALRDDVIEILMGGKKKVKPMIENADKGWVCICITYRGDFMISSGARQSPLAALAVGVIILLGNRLLNVNLQKMGGVHCEQHVWEV